MVSLRYISIGLLTAGLALGAGVHAAANVWRDVQPARALQLRAHDARALSLHADRQLEDGVGTAVPVTINAEVMRRALAAEPLSAPALRWLALDAGDEQARAGRLIALAHQVSRRDLGTQYWSIENASARGDLAATLAHYDAALSVAHGAGEVLFPILSAALSDANIRAGLVPYVRAGRGWVPGFLTYATTTGNAVDGVVGVIMAAGGPLQDPRVAGLDAQILGRLASDGKFMLAGSYLDRMTAAGAGQTREIGFSEASTNAAIGPFAWNLADQPSMGAQLGAPQAIHIRVAGGHRGIVARRVMILAPGVYELRQRVDFPPMSAPADASWQWHCMGANSLVWTQIIPVRSSAVTYASNVTIPARCQVVRMSLTVRGDEGSGDAEIVIGELRLTAK